MANTENILIVEDTLLVRNQLRTRLQSEGYRVKVASNVSQALQSIRAQAPDLVVLDLALPEDDPFASLTDGFALLRLIRSTPDIENLLVVIYSVTRTPEIEARARMSGVASVVAKKEGLSALLTAIRTALDERKSQQDANATAMANIPPDDGANI